MRQNKTRGLLFNWPLDVVAVVNGKPITKSDKLNNKRHRQRQELDRKRHSLEDVIKPAFIWAFDNGPIFPFGGGYLYIKTFKREWSLTFRTPSYEAALLVMRAFPCGVEPLQENISQWMKAFIETYPKPSSYRPEGQILAWVRLSCSGNLVEISPNRAGLFLPTPSAEPLNPQPKTPAMQRIQAVKATQLSF